MAAKSKTSKLHEDVPKNYWKKDAPGLSFGREHFRVVVFTDVRRKSKAIAYVDSLVESINWTDKSPVLEGEIVIRKPDRNKAFNTIREGNQVVLYVDRLGNGQFKELWRMRCREPSVDGAEGTITFKLLNDLSRYAMNNDTYEYRKNQKKHPKEWRGDEIVRAAAHKAGIPVGRLIRTEKTYAKFKKKDASFMDVVNAVYEDERDKTGRRYLVSWKGGKLYVTTLNRPKYMWLMGPTLVNYSYSRAALGKDFATMYEVRATIKAKGKRKKRKIHFKITSETLVRRWGVIKQKLSLPSVTSHSDAVKQAREKLVKGASPKKEISLSHPGIPTAGRGDSIHLQIYEDLGENWVVFVKEVVHTVTAGSYMMDITLQWTDPWVDKKGDKIRKKRAKAAADRRRKWKAKQKAARSSRSRAAGYRQRSDSGNRR
jgi:hypothetical protein